MSLHCTSFTTREDKKKKKNGKFIKIRSSQPHMLMGEEKGGKAWAKWWVMMKENVELSGQAGSRVKHSLKA